SQQQGSGNSYRFTSQHGEIDLKELALISEPGNKVQETPDMLYDVTHAYSNTNTVPARGPEEIIISTIEKLNVLFERGQITEQEFSAKKAELLSRL
ncbi:MAG TPA: SHOCT domain-containing protein, partial [Dyadobacter sp.]|nr:SHOCT domain-containing protein [Dyadobacter sp.]